MVALMELLVMRILAVAVAVVSVVLARVQVQTAVVVLSSCAIQTHLQLLSVQVLLEQNRLHQAASNEQRLLLAQAM
jgi:hypothetical protein